MNNRGYESGSPKVSVIIATSNSEEHLSECLDSVLSQTFDDIEVIVADVMSTDGTQGIISDYEERDDRVRGSSGTHEALDR